MKLALPAFALGVAGLTAAQYTNQSKPFHLVLESDNKTVNGDTLSACHVGAAIESLCLSKGLSTSNPDGISPSEFRFNTSNEAETSNTTLGATGILTYDLPAEPVIPSGLDFSYDPITNFVLPLMFPGGGSNPVYTAFDAKGYWNVQGYVNYRTNPPTSGDTVAYYRWYSCSTYYSGYQYVNLVWALGSAAPETPGCSKVSVKRVFV